MKNIFLITFFLLLNISLFAQRFPGGSEDRPQVRERLEQFEKIRLLEILNLDEETAVKFILRRKEHRKTMKSIMDKRFSLIEELANNLKLENYSENNIKKDIDKILKIEKELAEERNRFVLTLYDILTVEQVAKVITFEDRFKSDLKEMIEKRGNHRKIFDE